MVRTQNTEKNSEKPKGVVPLIDLSQVDFTPSSTPTENFQDFSKSKILHFQPLISNKH